MGILSTLCLKNAKRVEVYHSGYLRYKLQAFLCKPFIRHYIAVSKDAKRQLVQQFEIKPEKVTVAYNGVDLDGIRSKAIDMRGIHDKVRFLTIGRLAYPKNIDLSVEAYAQLAQKKQDALSEYLIAGDGPDREMIEAKSKGNVDFLGLIDRDSVCSQLASADVVVFPSLWEGNSIALLETIAVGTSLLVTDIPSFREVLGNEPLSEQELFRPEPFGAVFHKDSVKSCMAAMEYLIEHKQLFQSMKSFVGTIADNYTLEKQCQKYLDVAVL
jgi:glycosyltransferase involved in cell wall biosynthesis